MRTTTKPDAIRKAAQELFLLAGLQRTSMDAIAAQAKVSKQTLYRYYRSKDDLFVAVLSDLTSERVRVQVEELMPRAPLTREQLEEKLLIFAVRALDALLDPTYLALVRIVIAESAAFPDLARLYRTAVISRGAGTITSLLRSEHVAPLISLPEPDAALRLLVGPLLSYVLGALLGDVAEIRTLAEAELPAVIKLFVTAVSPTRSASVRGTSPSA